MYTPGPWKIEGEIWNDGGIDYLLGGCFFCKSMGFKNKEEITTIETDGYKIAQLSRPHPASDGIYADNRTNAEIRANAELIAAAPDMYEALGDIGGKMEELEKAVDVLLSFDYGDDGLQVYMGKLAEKVFDKINDIDNILELYSKLSRSFDDNE